MRSGPSMLEVEEEEEEEEGCGFSRIAGRVRLRTIRGLYGLLGANSA